VSFAYGATPIVRDVSLEVRAGALVGILGPNGSGKTTLLKLIGGALRPGSGTVMLGGADVTSMPRRTLAQRVAVVPQETHLAFDYTALEIVLMGRYPHLGPFEVEGPADLEAALDALSATGTRALADRAFPTLSGGEKQRVIIASALAQLAGVADVAAVNDRPEGPGGSRPENVLLLDEPTASLDLRYQLEVASLVRRLHDERGITVILSTHDLRFAASLCQQIVLLSNGRVLAQGPADRTLTPELVGQLYDIGADVAAPLLTR
jgi:iron complex transport system ATP-binding protein